MSNKTNSKTKTIYPSLSAYEKIRTIFSKGEGGKKFITHLIKSFAWHKDQNEIVIKDNSLNKCCIMNRGSVDLLKSPKSDKLLCREAYEAIIKFHQDQFHGKIEDQQKHNTTNKKPFNKKAVKQNRATYKLGDVSGLSNLKNHKS